MTQKYEVQFVTMDAGYKTPWIAKKTMDDEKILILPYTRYHGDKERYKPWEYTYDPVNDIYICPRGGVLRHTTTLCTAQRNDRACLCGCKREARNAIYTPQRSDRSHEMGQAEICCHESEKAGELELEQRLFLTNNPYILSWICRNPSFRLTKTGVL